MAGYGVVGGTGVGVADITGPAMIVKWFPDKRGMAAGIATLGFGAGAVLTAPLGAWLVEGLGGVPRVFLVLAGVYLVLDLPFAFFLQDPPEDWDAPDSAEGVDELGDMRRYALGEAVRTIQWWSLTAMLFLNVTVGIGLITLAQSITEELTTADTALAAILVSILGVWNGVGRPGLAALSDRTGRMKTMLGMFVVQAACFAALPVSEPFPLVVPELRDLTGGFETVLWGFAAVSLLAAILPAVTKPPEDRRPDEQREATTSSA